MATLLKYKKGLKRPTLAWNEFAIRYTHLVAASASTPGQAQRVASNDMYTCCNVSNTCTLWHFGSLHRAGPGVPNAHHKVNGVYISGGWTAQRLAATRRGDCRKTAVDCRKTALDCRKTAVDSSGL